MMKNNGKGKINAITFTHVDKGRCCFSTFFSIYTLISFSTSSVKS